MKQNTNRSSFSPILLLGIYCVSIAYLLRYNWLCRNREWMVRLSLVLYIPKGFGELTLMVSSSGYTTWVIVVINRMFETTIRIRAPNFPEQYPTLQAFLGPEPNN